MSYPNLCAFKECPEHLQSNEYILHGYRVDFSKLQCIKSIFMLTNETINVWSHLLGVIFFLYALIRVNFKVLVCYELSTPADHIVMSLFCLCFMTCLLLSTFYHVFSCHSKEYYECCLRFDLMGISLSLWGCYIPSIYYGFYCFKIWRTFYTAAVVMMMLLNMAFQICPKRVYTKKTDYRRVTFFVLMCLFGVFPAIHWVYMLGLSNALVLTFIPKVVMMYAFGLIAFIFYITKVPEKLKPGWFDYIGSSHQIWHIAVLAAMIWWYFTALEFIELRLHSKLSCALDIV